MAMNLQQMRDFVRLSLDIEEDDLPDLLLDGYIREGSKRIERAEARWPFYEMFYSFTIGVNPIGLYPVSSVNAAVDQIASIAYSTSTYPALKWMGIDTYQQMPTRTGRPEYYAQWGDYLAFWPTADDSYDTIVRAYRKATDWVADGAGAEPDLPDELHNTILAWTLSKAYLQQEDPEMAAVYERQFADELNEFRRRLVITPHNQPLVLNGGPLRSDATMLARPRFDWET